MIKLAVKIDELLNNTPQDIKSKAKNYVPRLMRTQKNRWVYKVGDYTVRIRVSLPVIRLKDSDVFVSCTCKFWKWNGPDFNAASYGYLERQMSDLTPPDVRDPNNKFLICKHVFSALKAFKKDATNVF